MNWLVKTNNRYLKTVLVSFSIWIMAILINAVLFAITTFMQGGRGHFWQATGLVLLVSALYSLPGIIIFWLVFLFKFYHRNIFTILLITATITSFFSVLVMLLLLSNGTVNFQSMPLFFMAILSAVIAVTLHRPAIFDIYISDKNKIYTNEKVDALET